MTVEKVYLIRHGETEWNITGRWQGILDPPLNDIGREQAQKLAAYLRNEPIQAIYTSDLSRAADTAQTLANALGLSPVIDKRLRELHIGVFQGLTKPEILQKYPQEFAEFMAEPFEYCILEGESRRQLQERMRDAWQEITSTEGIHEIAIVTHGGAIKMLLSALFPEKKDAFEAHDFPNVSITVLKSVNETWRIPELAKTPHLDAESKEKGDDTLYF
jgi:2,3-bisphosphoglycerate-dependent phosphoglycerate mutase